MILVNIIALGEVHQIIECKLFYFIFQFIWSYFSIQTSQYWTHLFISTFNLNLHYLLVFIFMQFFFIRVFLF